MATLELTFSDYYQRVSDFLGLGTSPTGSNLTKVKDIVYRGYRQFLYPSISDPRTGKTRRHTWSFLKQLASLVTSDGKWRYSLPTDFGRMITDPAFSKDDAYEPLKKVRKDAILNMRVDSDSKGYPFRYAIAPLKYDLEIGTVWEIWLYETPDQAYVLNYFYLINPPKPTSDTDFLIGGIECNEAILESCLSVAESQEEDASSTHHTQLAAKLLRELIEADTIDTPNTLGRMTCPRDISKWNRERDILTNFQDSNLYT